MVRFVLWEPGSSWSLARCPQLQWILGLSLAQRAGTWGARCPPSACCAWRAGTQGEWGKGGHAVCPRAHCPLSGWSGVPQTARHPSGHRPSKCGARLGPYYNTTWTIWQETGLHGLKELRIPVFLSVTFNHTSLVSHMWTILSMGLISYCSSISHTV